MALHPGLSKARTRPVRVAHLTPAGLPTTLQSCRTAVTPQATQKSTISELGSLNCPRPLWKQLTESVLYAGVVLCLQQQPCLAEEPTGATYQAPAQEGSCPDCVGEFNSVLNTCTLSSVSCVSTSNDDQSHFVAPWSYDGSAQKAVQKLLDVATGGAYDPGLISRPYVSMGYSRIDAVGYTAQNLLSSITGGPAPDRLKPKRDKSGFTPFDGQQVEQHRTADGGEYVRITFDLNEAGDAGDAIDAEFMFLPDDNIVTVRAASRAAPDQLRQGNLALSFDTGVAWDVNVARRKLEELRKALNWEVTPVISSFDPKFNNNKAMWFEQLYSPFKSSPPDDSDP